MASLRDLEDKLKNLFGQGVSAVGNAVHSFNQPVKAQGVGRGLGAAQPIVNKVVNTKFLPGQTNTINQSFRNVISSPGRGILSSDLVNGSLNTGNRAIDTNVIHPVGHALNSFVQNSSLGFIQPPSSPTRTWQDKVGAGVGLAASFANPLNPLNSGLAKVGGMGEKLVLKGIGNRVAPTIVKSALKNVGSQAAQTGALALTKGLAGQQFDAGQDLLMGLGTRGLFGASSRLTNRQTPEEITAGYRKDAFKQVKENGESMIDALKRYTSHYEENTPASFNDAIKIQSDLETAYKQLYGATKKPPQNIYDLANKVKQGFREYYAPPGVDARPRQSQGLPAMGISGEPLSSEGIVKNGKVKIQALPTQTEILNRSEVNAGRPDLYTQRQADINNEPLPWEQPGYKAPPEKPRVAIPTDEGATTRAEAATELGSNGTGGSGGFNSLTPEVQKEFQGWVNNRRASKIEGLVKHREFSDLNNKGIDGILEFQGGNKTGRFGEVKKYFDFKRQEYITKTGDRLGYHDDYLPGLWDNTDEEIQKVFGNRLGLKPSFTHEKVIKDYETGIKAGLKPKFQNISQLAGWYEGKVNKAIADHQFFNYLGKGGFIQPSGKAPQGWVTVDPDRFPKINVKTSEGNYGGVYKAPPELAEVINNYLREPQFKALENIANFVSRAKNITLNFGIPGTAINAHGVNILARHTLFGSGGNPITRFLKGGAYMLRPGMAEAELNKNLAYAPEAVKNGLTLSPGDFMDITKGATTKAGKFVEKWDDAFGSGLFEKMIPSLKLSSYQALTKEGMDGKSAAKLLNNVYGGINWEQMGRNRDTQNLFRAIFLAPDWGETTLRMGGNLAKSLTPWAKSDTAKRYRTMTATLAASYVALNIANKLSSGHYAYENEPGHTFELEAGYTSDGSKRYLRPYGTGADFARLPYDIMAGLAKGDPTTAFRSISNRLSMPLGSVMHLATNTDYKGQAIYGRDKYGNQLTPMQSATGVGGEVIGAVGFPSFAKNLIDVGSGKQGAEQGILQALEMPVRYQSPGNSKTQNFVGSVANVKGKELYDIKKRFQGESPFSENQKTMINQGGMPVLDQIMQSRGQDRMMKKAEEIQTQAANGQITPEEAQKAIDNILNTQAPKNKQSSVGGTNRAYAAESSQSSFKSDLDTQMAKKKVKLSGSPIYLPNGDIAYKGDSGEVKTIDMTPPAKGSGIDAFSNENWQYAKARSVLSAPIPDEMKQSAYKKLGVTPQEVEYDYKATKSNDIKSQYVLSKADSMDHETLLSELVKGRVPSVSGATFASDGVINNLMDAGYLTKQEAAALKKLDYDKNGKLKKTSSGTGKRKGAKISISTVKISPVKTTPLKLSKPKRVKLSKTPTFTLSKAKTVKPLKFKSGSIKVHFSSKPSLSA